MTWPASSVTQENVTILSSQQQTPTRAGVRVKVFNRVLKAPQRLVNDSCCILNSDAASTFPGIFSLSNPLTDSTFLYSLNKPFLFLPLSSSGARSVLQGRRAAVLSPSRLL